MSARTHQFVESESRRYVLLSFTLQTAKDIQGYVLDALDETKVGSGQANSIAQKIGS